MAFKLSNKGWETKRIFGGGFVPVNADFLHTQFALGGFFVFV
jgi:hypothetical protein